MSCEMLLEVAIEQVCMRVAAFRRALDQEDRETAQHGVTPAEALELGFVEELMMKYDHW